MIQCPKCGAMNPDGFRNCKECYYPFGLENAVGGAPPAGGTPPVQGNIQNGPPPSGMPPPQPYAPGDVHAHQAYAPGDVHGHQAYPPGGAPPGIDPVSGKPMQVLAVRPIRKVHPGIWVALGVLAVLIIFAIAWFLTHRGGGGDPYLQKVFNNMENVQGWEADVRVDSSGFGSGELTFYLGDSWEGSLTFQSPDRFSMVAHALGSEGSYGLRIIDGNLYEWDYYTGVWKNMGPATEEQMGTNPVWLPAFNSNISLTEEAGLQEIDGHVCKVFSFDKEETITEESMFGDYEFTTHYVGSFYVDSTTDLLVSIDFIAEISDYGRTHYRYNFHSHGSQTSVEVPPGAVAPISGG